MIVSARYSQIWVRNCETCQVLFVARHPNALTCGRDCSIRRRNASNARTRWKASHRRQIERLTDITIEQEELLRSRARKCRICDVYMTSKPGKPNSKHLDHIVPINVGGTHTHGNIRIICRDCNLSRPKDGSDYTGPVTLWATAPGVVLASKPMTQPKIRQRVVTGQCECGNPIHTGKLRHPGSRCHECLVRLGREASALRECGLKWREIAERLDYSNTGALFGLAKRYASESETDIAS